MLSSYMATSGADGYLKLWDLRNYACLRTQRIQGGVENLEYSQRGILAGSRTRSVMVSVISIVPTGIFTICHRRFGKTGSRPRIFT